MPQLPLPVDPPSHVYRDHLTALSLGLPLWNPDPPRNPNPPGNPDPPGDPSPPGNPNLTKKMYDNVSIGDVGYLQEGTFMRMFNVMLPRDHPSNKTLGEPEFYESLDCSPFANTFRVDFNKVEHCSLYVSSETNDRNFQAMTPDK
jgi:hypothetical protein